MSATYAIYTSPTHKPIPDHLPTLIITPLGKPHQILYTYLHTNYNRENYLLTPSDQGDLCVAKLFPPSSSNSKRPNSHESNSQPSSGSSHHHSNDRNDRNAIRCEASRNLRWTIRNEGIQNPVYKLTLPNPDNQQVEQPLFQVSKPNPNSPWWTLFYFTYAGHLIPPKRIEFGKIMKHQGGSGETRISVTGKTDEEKAVWKTLGDGNEDMVEWILICASLNVLDDEITKAAEAAGVKLSRDTGSIRLPNPQSAPIRQLHPTGNVQNPPGPAPIRPAIYHADSQKVRTPPTNPGPSRAQYPVVSSPSPAGRGPPAPPVGGRPFPGPQPHHPQSMASSQGSSRSSNDSHRLPTTPNRGPNEGSYHPSTSRPVPNGSRPIPNGTSSTRVPPGGSYAYDQQVLQTGSRGSPHGSSGYESRPQVGLRAMAQNQLRAPPSSSQPPPQTYQQTQPHPHSHSQTQHLQNHHASSLRSANPMAQNGRAPIQVQYDHTSPLRVRKVK
ncbi:uncharacterized protein MELLADRAFT_50289 [Melampsora larici-populina 98AG31]|uniref:Uncharacterized protein n=1 Tax=Melampsora larici-populina (strain 98AG31 / pathotype 3-4-7) TaxID=747676 RepID=F4S3H2_MELLP|nr:uncharacterized protein MELLADRAFT_50289 [Melampsora larici-populina 98AG31]EGG00838.1 hypothetical protein MELLADRAFT_50289 [Melampsora larici-populina 98AG31]